VSKSKNKKIESIYLLENDEVIPLPYEQKGGDMDDEESKKGTYICMAT